MLRLQEVCFGFPSRPEFLGPVSLDVLPGECWAIVGPNGAGKSTLLRLMAGLIGPQSGRIEICGQTLQTVALRDRARRIAFLPQRLPGDVDFTVHDIVLMGRFPHRSVGLFETTNDRRIAWQTMARTGTLHLADRRLGTLSGGEAQRVHVAASLAQEPEVLLLDEPTAALDLQHQLSIFRILQAFALELNKSVVVVTHDANLAARFCTQIILLSDGKVVAIGSPAVALTREHLERVYCVRVAVLEAPQLPGQPWMVPIDLATGSEERS